MVIELSPDKVDLHYDELDSNAINFRWPSGYFSIQTGVYLEPDDDPYYDPYFELNEQDCSQAGGFSKIAIDGRSIEIELAAGREFLDKYSAIRISVKVTDEIIDFFNNYLFLGHLISYGPAIDDSRRIKQTETRSVIDFDE